MIVSFSPRPAFSALAVSVTVGGKQYLLGLYDTAGQVSVLAPGRTPPPFPQFRVSMKGLWKLTCLGGRVCLQGSLWIKYFFFQVTLGKGKKKNLSNKPRPAYPM